jgi:predicted nucleic acid-binding protein
MAGDPRHHLPRAGSVIAVDTNLLGYAHRRDWSWHAAARDALTGLAEGLGECLTTGRTAGAQVHNARIAALCLAHGVRELWTHDRDFGRFPTLTVRNPRSSHKQEPVRYV